MLPILSKNLTLSGYTVFAFTGYPSMGMPQQTEAVAAAKAFLVPRLADGRLKPLVSETFKLEQVVDAHRSLESNNQTGKIVLLVVRFIKKLTINMLSMSLSKASFCRVFTAQPAHYNM
jgi:NADPH:quinone reductase-like Zn-dependent oxidoreductase